MEAKLSVVDGLIKISVEQVLTDVQLEKFENAKLRPQIEAAAKDFQLDWGISLNGNIATLTVDTITGPSILSERISIVKKNAIDFKKTIDNMELPEPAVETSPEEKALEDESDFDFIKHIINEWDESEDHWPISGFAILVRTDLGHMPYGVISDKLAKELCKSYLKVHSNDLST